MYKYELAVYVLYSEFGDKIFCRYEAEAALQKEKYFQLYSRAIDIALRRNFTERVSFNEAKKHRKNYHHAMSFARLSKKGLEYCKYMDDHPELITKYLLRGKHNGKLLIKG